MKCPRCQSEEVNVQMVTESQLRTKHHGVMWWLLWGIYWVPIKWCFFTLPALLIKIFGHKKQKIVTTHKRIAVCQNCGNTWNI